MAAYVGMGGRPPQENRRGVPPPGKNTSFSQTFQYSPAGPPVVRNMRNNVLGLSQGAESCSCFPRGCCGNDWINCERSWVLVHNRGNKIAVCPVYMAAKVTGNSNFKNWNDAFNSCLQSELKSLEGEGYKCIIVGDMNAHIGQPHRGQQGGSH